MLSLRCVSQLCFVFVLCVCSSACFIGRRGRVLDRAVEHSFQCAAAEGYRYERLEDNRYRIHACRDVAKDQYKHRAVFYCSKKRCRDLTSSARQYFSVAATCPLEQVKSAETVDPSAFSVWGCQATATLRCEMRNQEVTCYSVATIPQLAQPVHVTPAVAPATPETAPTPAPEAAPTAGGEDAAPTTPPSAP